MGNDQELNFAHLELRSIWSVIDDWEPRIKTTFHLFADGGRKQRLRGEITFHHSLGIFIKLDKFSSFCFEIEQFEICSAGVRIILQQ